MRDKITYGEKYKPAMKVKTREEALAYLEECVQHQMRVGNFSREEALEIELTNIGYWAGYYDQETYNRVMELYDTSHPVFGDVYPSPATAFDVGAKLGKNYQMILNIQLKNMMAMNGLPKSTKLGVNNE